MPTKSEILRYLRIIVAVVIMLLIPAWKGIDGDLISRWDAVRGQLLAEASEKSIEEQIDQLESEEAIERIAALVRLREADPEDVLPLLLKARNIDKRNWETHRDLVRAWGADAIPVLIDILRNSNLLSTEDSRDEAFLGWSAVDALAVIGSEADDAIPLLLDKLKYSYSDVINNYDICEALESIGVTSEEIIDALLQVLDDDEGMVRKHTACYALGELASPGDQEVIDRLLEFVDEYESNPRIILWHYVIPARCALYELGWAQEENFSLITEKATDDSGLINPEGHRAWEALAKIANDLSIEVLGNVILESEDMALMLAFGYLAEIGPRTDVIEIFIKALDRPSFDVDTSEINVENMDIPDSTTIEPAYYAALMLGKFGSHSEDALPKLLNMYTNLAGTDDERELEFIDLMEEAIIRIHEGI